MMGISGDFKFWEDRLPGDLQTRGGSDGDEIEFQIQGHDEDQLHMDHPPQSWARIPENYGREASPLLQDKHSYSCPSPASRLRAILDARRELMEMVKHMPESAYELSLKDIVEAGEGLLVEEMKSMHKMEERIPRHNKSTTSTKICRTESMDSGVFLLKMFLPASLSSKKKSKSIKSMKICPQPFPHGSEKQPSKDWWKIISLSVKDNKNRENIRRSNSDISGSKSRLVENSWAPSEWSFRNKKCRSSGLRGCLF